MANAITKAGDVQVEALEIISAANKTIDIRSQLIELNLFEDLYSNCMSGTVMIQDSFNFLINLPLVGEEQIHIRFKTPTLKSDQAIDRTFAIYKVSDRIVKNRSLVYQIHFISPEAIIDSNKAISRSFGGRVSDMVENVLRQGMFLGTKKELKIEATSNSLTFIPAYWSPFKCIKYCTARALNSSLNSGFLFYETNKNFVFASTDSLVSQQPLFEYIESESSNRDNSGSDFEAAYKKLLAIRMDTSYDYLDRLKSGMYGAEINLINPINKSQETVILKYNSFYDHHKHLDKYPLHTDQVLGYVDSNLSFESYMPFVYDSKNARSSQWKIQRRMLLSEMNAIKFEIEVHGRTDMEVGKVVKLTLPAYTAINEGDRAKDVTDNMYSGNYVVSAINHRLSLTSHKMIMEVIRDSYGSEIKVAK